MSDVGRTVAGIEPPALPDAAVLAWRSARLGAARALPAVSPGWIDFGLALLRAQCAVLPEAGRLVVGIPSPAGAPLLDVAHLDLPDAPLRELIRAVVAEAMACGQPGSSVADLVQALGAEDGLASRMVTAAATADAQALGAIGERYALPADALTLLGRAAMAPFAASAVVRLWERRGAWEPGASLCCPCCGSVPSLASLGRVGEGKRRLHCGLCGTRWSFPRIECPFCGTADQEQLGFLKVGDDEAAWIETCEHCRAAIRTVDERRLAGDLPLDPWSEALVGLHLDLLAVREGYHPAPTYVALT